MTTKKLPLHLENTNYSFYANFGERIVAVILDGLFLCPLTLGVLYFNSMHLYYYYYTFVVMLVGIMAYSIYLPVRYGATPGKRIMGLTILKINGTAISYRESFLKYMPMLIIGLFAFVIQSWTIALADASTYDGLGWMEQTKYLKSLSPIPLWLQTTVIYGYYIAAIVMVLTNDRKRSVSDQVAGTVVVYTRCLEKIAELEITTRESEAHEVK